jgi:hypothetical protein
MKKNGLGFLGFSQILIKYEQVQSSQIEGKGRSKAKGDRAKNYTYTDGPQVKDVWSTASRIPAAFRLFVAARRTESAAKHPALTPQCGVAGWSGILAFAQARPYIKWTSRTRVRGRCLALT